MCGGWRRLCKFTGRGDRGGVLINIARVNGTLLLSAATGRPTETVWSRAHQTESWKCSDTPRKYSNMPPSSRFNCCRRLGSSPCRVRPPRIILLRASINPCYLRNGELCTPEFPRGVANATFDTWARVVGTVRPILQSFVGQALSHRAEWVGV